MGEDRILVAIELLQRLLDMKILTEESGEWTFDFSYEYEMANFPDELKQSLKKIYKKWEPILIDRGLFCLFRRYRGFNVCWNKNLFEEKKIEIKEEETN